MTNEEAIYELETNVDYKTLAIKEACQMAIEALEQKEKTVEEYRNRLMDAFHNADCDELIAVVVRPEESEFKQLEWLLKNHYHNQKQQPCDLDDAREDFMNDVYNTLDFLPTNNEANRIIDSFDRVTSGLKQQPCEDWYDVPSDEMTLEQAKQAVKDLRKKLVEYLEQQPCEDCISREAVNNGFKKYENGSFAYGCVWDYINKLPSVTPKEKTGKWIIKDGKEQGYDIAGIKTWYIQIMCDKCGFIKPAIEGHIGQYHFCPNCGARMVSE